MTRPQYNDGMQPARIGDVTQAPSNAAQNESRGLLWFFFSLEGRIGRLQLAVGTFISSMIAFALVGSLFFILVASLQLELERVGHLGNWFNSELFSSGLLFAWACCVLPGLWTNFALYIKRWHDRDKSGLWCLILLVPLLGPLWMLLECSLFPGTAGENRYGQRSRIFDSW